MSSSLSFYMQQNKAKEQTKLTFNGAGIKLLELKKRVVDLKYSSNVGADFDFNVKDANGKKYTGDDELVPKDSVVSVQRVPVRNHLGLLARIRGDLRGNPNRRGHDEIVMPMQEEEDDAPLIRQAPVKQEPVKEEEAEPVEEEEEEEDEVAAGLEALQALEGEAATTYTGTGLTAFGTAYWSTQRGAPTGGGPGGGGGYSHSNMQCTRCGEWGHNPKMCMTVGDPAYDPVQIGGKLPKALRTTVESLEGIDTTNKTVIANDDGTFDLVGASSAGLKALQRDGYVPIIIGVMGG